MTKKIFVAVIGVWVFATTGFSQQEAVYLKAQIDKARAKTSETVTLTVSLRLGDEFLALEVPDFEDNFSGLRVVDFGSSEARKGDDGRWLKENWYKLRADISGSYVIPALQLKYQHGQEQKEVATSEIFVEFTTEAVKPTDSENADVGLRDIKNIIPLDKEMGLIWYVLIALALFGIMLAGMLYWQRRRNVDKEEDIEPPHILAERQLSQLKNSNLLESGEIKAFHFELSEVLRRYFEGRFGYAATDKTFDEIKREVSSISGVEAMHKQAFLDVLRETEVVKFTDHNPGREKSLSILDSSVEFVAGTKPTEAVGEDSVI